MNNRMLGLLVIIGLTILAWLIGTGKINLLMEMIK